MRIVPILVVGLLIFPIMFMGNVTPIERVKAIIVYKDKVQDSDIKVLEEQGSVVKNKLDIINGISVELPKAVFDKIDYAIKHGQAGYEKLKYIQVDQQVQMLEVDMARGNKHKPSTTPSPTPIPVPQVIPWGITDVNAPQAWVKTNGSGIKVAVLDTGIDYTHPDLAGRVIGGYNFISNPANYMDDNGHGTHCAGIIAANDNEIGVVGVAPGASLYAVKVLNSQGSGYTSNVIRGIQWAVTHGAQVISMSLGSSSDNLALHDAVDAAYNSGVVVVAAAGNSGGPVAYPAAYDSAIAVGAVDSSNTIASFSSNGPQVDLAAPGVSIYSTYPGGYADMSGTSMACPHVSGVVALVLANQPGLNPAEVRQKLIDTAHDLGAPGFDYYYGYGLVNAKNAVA